LDVVELIVDNQGADDEKHRYTKLKNYQKAAQTAAFKPGR
jgi:hypothetical protein